MQKIAQLRRRYPVTFGLGVGIFLAAGAAVAAFVIYSGASGSGGGNFASSSTVDAITLSSPGASSDLNPGGTASLDVFEANNDPNSAEHITSLSSGFTSSPDATCAQHLTTSSLTPLTNVSLGPSQGAVKVATLTITADSALPLSCAGGSWTINFTGQTATG